MFNVIKDVRSGALPYSQIAGFIVWAIGKSFWFLFFVLVVAVAAWIAIC